MEPIDQNNLLKSQWIELHQIRILKAHNKHDQNCLQTDLTIIWTIPFNSEISLRIRSRENKALPSHERNPFFDQNFFTVLNRMIDSYTCKAALLWCGDCALEPWDEQSWLDKAFAKPLLINALFFPSLPSTSTSTHFELSLCASIAASSKSLLPPSPPHIGRTSQGLGNHISHLRIFE